MRRSQANPRKVSPSVHRATVTPLIGLPSQAEIQFRSIVQATADLYGIWNIVSGKMCLCEGSLAAFGYLAAESLNRAEFFENLIHADDRAAFQSRLKSHLAGKTPALDCEFRLRTKAGSYKWLRFFGRSVHKARAKAPTQLAGIGFHINERKEQAEELTRSHALMPAVVEAAQDCISVVDPVDFRLIAFNKSYEELILKARGVHVRPGMLPEEVNPERAANWKTFFRQVLTQGKVSQDYKLHSLDATHHIFAQSIVMNGQVKGICLFQHDITDRKQVELALRRSEERFAKAFRQAPFALTLASLRDHRWLEVNDAFAEMSGYSREELIGKTPYEIGFWVFPENRRAIEREVLQHGEVNHIEVSLRTRSGELREAEASAVLIDIDGEPCMMVEAIDITERKRAAEALQESEERLRIAIDAGRMHAFEWDHVTDVVQRTGLSTSVLDYLDDGARHTKNEFIDQIQSEDKRNYIRLIESLTPEKPGYKVVFRWAHQDGRISWFEESGTGIFGPEGKLRKIIGITSDVTEARHSERALRELSRHLITSQEEERRRIARELHDQIGQQAALICVQTQRIDSGVSDEERTTRADVHELYKRVKALSGDISKLSHRLHSSELSLLGLGAAAQRLCSDFGSQYGVKVEYHAKSLPSMLDGKKSLCLYRVLQEALQNVAKHSRASRVTVELQAGAKELTLEVKDNGKGFDVENTGFDAGLGLLSMRERLNQVGGRLGIASKPGSGTKLSATVFL